MLMLRALALTMPAVTVDVRLNGLPTASTHSPTLSFSESPIFMVGNPVPSTFIKARSVDGSVPTIFATKDRLSFSTTVMESAPSTTWLLLTI